MIAPSRNVRYWAGADSAGNCGMFAFDPETDICPSGQPPQYGLGGGQNFRLSGLSVGGDRVERRLAESRNELLPEGNRPLDPHLGSDFHHSLGGDLEVIGGI